MPNPIIEALKTKVLEALKTYLAKYTIQDLTDLFLAKKANEQVFSGADDETTNLCAAMDELAAAEESGS